MDFQRRLGQWAVWHSFKKQYVSWYDLIDGCESVDQVCLNSSISASSKAARGDSLARTLFLVVRGLAVPSEIVEPVL